MDNPALRYRISFGIAYASCRNNNDEYHEFSPKGLTNFFRNNEVVSKSFTKDNIEELKKAYKKYPESRRIFRSLFKTRTDIKGKKVLIFQSASDICKIMETYENCPESREFFLSLLKTRTDATGKEVPRFQSADAVHEIMEAYEKYPESHEFLPRLLDETKKDAGNQEVPRFQSASDICEIMETCHTHPNSVQILPVLLDYGIYHDNRFIPLKTNDIVQKMKSFHNAPETSRKYILESTDPLAKISRELSPEDKTRLRRAYIKNPRAVAGLFHPEGALNATKLIDGKEVPVYSVDKICYFINEYC